MATATAARKTDAPKALPVPNGDFYQLVELLNADELAVVKKVPIEGSTRAISIATNPNSFWLPPAHP